MPWGPEVVNSDFILLHLIKLIFYRQNEACGFYILQDAHSAVHGNLFLSWKVYIMQCIALYNRYWNDDGFIIWHG